MKRALACALVTSLAVGHAYAQDAADPAPPADVPAATDGLPGEPRVDAPAVQADAAAAEGALSEAELQELGFSASAPAVDTSLKLSGFMDFGSTIGMDDKTRFLTGKQAFYLGNVNVYISKSLSESIRTMAEIRFTYLPNGAPESQANAARASTATADYSDFGRNLRWGGIEIERAYVEWAATPWLTVRAGQYLTPYGIWNVDHGSPTIITAVRPFVVGNNYFPERQTGFELYGRWEATSNSGLGYHLTLSNGTGPASEYKELDKNKAVGGRLFWDYRKFGELRVGGSIYYGRNTESNASSALVNGAPSTTERITLQYDALSLAADAVWRYGGMHVQAEFISRQVRYTEEGRTPQFSLATLQPRIPADAFSWGGYLLLGYRFEWGGVMPYVLVQRVKSFNGVDKDQAVPMSVGVNVRPIDALALKVEFQQVVFDDEAVFPKDTLRLCFLQAAWAF